jgi:hypothetical protein
MTALAAEQREAGATVKALSAEETNELEGGITVQEVQPVLVAIPAIEPQQHPPPRRRDS